VRLLPHIARLMMDKFVQKLISQRTTTIDAQQMAAAELAALEQRLAQTWATPRTLYGWLATADHKIIGRRYIVTAFVFLALGGETTGPGPLARYEQLAADLGIGDRVRFLGFRSDVADVLRAADLVVLPSLDEGLPLALLEAMACAKPVIATPVGGVPEAVIDEVTGVLVPPNEPERLASAVLRVLNDRHLSLRMGNAGRGRVQAQFSVPRLVAAVEALYTEVLSGRRDNGATSIQQSRATASHAASPTVLQS